MVPQGRGQEGTEGLNCVVPGSRDEKGSRKTKQQVVGRPDGPEAAGQETCNSRLALVHCRIELLREQPRYMHLGPQVSLRTEHAIACDLCPSRS